MTDHSRFIGDSSDLKITPGPPVTEPLVKTSNLQLKELRLHAGLTQQQVADKTGMRRAHISRLESSNDARLSTVMSYMHAIGGHVELVTAEQRTTLELAA